MLFIVAVLASQGRPRMRPGVGKGESKASFPYDWNPGEPAPRVRTSSPRALSEQLEEPLQTEPSPVPNGDSHEPAVGVYTTQWQTIHVMKESATTEVISFSPGRIPISRTKLDNQGILAVNLNQRGCELTHEDLFTCYAPRAGGVPSFEFNLANSPDRKHILYRRAYVEGEDEASESACNAWESSFSDSGDLFWNDAEHNEGSMGVPAGSCRWTPIREECAIAYADPPNNPYTVEPLFLSIPLSAPSTP